MSEAPASLGALIDAQIRAAGPMSLSTYMSLCLGHPTFGYYRTRDPFGRAGDFVTAPEISQMFGEMIGAFVASAWHALGQPDRFDLVELGPGRGTLMSDILRVASGPPGLIEAMRLLLVETSEPLIAAQREKLAPVVPVWCASVDNINPEGPPLIVVANEFYDVLPIKQFQKLADGWHERLVGLVDGKRRFGPSPLALPRRALPEAVRSSAIGTVWEAGLAAEATMSTLAGRLAKRKGTVLIIDYGYAETRTGETFQAVERHAFADPLARPGEADLTAHVDFEALARAARQAGVVPRPLLTQAQFLAAMGIVPRARALGATNPVDAESITADLRRLTAGDHMGALFKVLCITSPGLAPYPFGKG
ncbi:MAG: SAM-dependent methyltransferase [Cucumibacter sp.]